MIAPEEIMAAGDRLRAAEPGFRLAVTLRGREHALLFYGSEGAARDLGRAFAGGGAVERVDVARVGGDLLYSWGQVG